MNKALIAGITGQDGAYLAGAPEVAISVNDFLKRAFGHAGFSIEFEGTGKLEKRVVGNFSMPEIPVQKGEAVAEIDSRCFRSARVDLLQGDASKAKNKLGRSRKHSLHDLAKEMIEADIGWTGTGFMPMRWNMEYH